MFLSCNKGELSFHLNFPLIFDYCFWLFSLISMFCLKSMILVYFIYQSLLFLEVKLYPKRECFCSLYRDCNLNLLSLYSDKTNKQNLFYVVLVYYYIAILYLITFSSGEGYHTKHLGNYFVFYFYFHLFIFCLSIGFRGSRESLHSGMTYNARRGSNASIYQEGDYLFIFSLFFSLILFLFFAYFAFAAISLLFFFLTIFLIFPKNKNPFRRRLLLWWIYARSKL